MASNTFYKFQRKYNLNIQGTVDNSKVYSIGARTKTDMSDMGGGFFKVANISNPMLTLEFDIVRDTFAHVNNARFTIYNLAEETRKNIFHVSYDILPQKYQYIDMEAGYADGNMYKIFLGNVWECSSVRRGTDWVTTLTSFDGGIATLNSYVSINAPAGTTKTQLFNQIIPQLKYVKKGAIGNIEDDNSSKRGFAFFGKGWEAFKKVAYPHTAFIDLGQAYAIQDTEYISKPGYKELILNSSNIVGSPRRSGMFIEVDVVFEPSVYVGQLVTLNAREAYNNGQWQVRGIRHHGIISDAVNGECITTLTLWAGLVNKEFAVVR